MIKLPKAQRNTSLSTVVVASLVGGLAGAVVGLMFAPKSGKALRQGIQEKADNVLIHAGDVTFYHTGALKRQGTDLVDKGKQLAEDLHTFILESLKIKKTDYIPLDIKATHAEETVNSPNLAEKETEVAPLTLVQPEIPLQEE